MAGRLVAAEQDRAATLALTETLRDDLDPADRGRAITEATLKPLPAAELLVELVEHLCEEEPNFRQSVASDLFGGVELVNSAFTAMTMTMTMTIESNLKSENSKHLSVSCDLVELSKRRDIVWRSCDPAITRARRHQGKKAGASCSCPKLI